MKNEEMEKIQNSIQEKLGKEGTAKIADDLAKIITNNNEMNKTISERETKIERLNNDKEMLMMSNSQLLQQVGMTIDDDEKNKKKKEEYKEVNFNSFFDEKGNFKK